MKTESAALLFNAQLNYKKALVRFRDAMQNIVVYCNHEQLVQGKQIKLPALKELNDDTFVMNVAGVKVACRYRHNLCGGALQFGYMKRMSNGEVILKVTKTLYLGKSGNIMDSKGGEPGPWSVQGEDFMVNVFFPECLGVIEARSSKV